MNCLDCRRLLLTVPDARDPALHTHLRECPSCARFASEQAAFERRLGDALRVPAPQNLRERVIFDASMFSRRRRRWLALVATLLLGIAIGMGGWEYVTGQRLSNDMVVHMANDPLHERPPQGTATLRLARLTVGLGAYVNVAELGEIVNARRCEINGRHGAHFVIERGDMRATAFLLPNVRLAMEHRVQAGGMHGVLIPTDGGVIAVFCPDRGMVYRLAEDIRHSVQWRA